MENSEATKRRIKIIIAYVVLFIILGFISYLVFASPATCQDGKQNQSEKGIDCGGPCAPCKEVPQTKDLVVKQTVFTLGGNNTYDAVAQISNPNDAVGAKTFNYTFTLKDASGTVIATRQGTSFILPADTKYLAELNLETDNNATPASADIEISSPEWGKLLNLSKPQVGVYEKKFGPIAGGGEGSQAEGTIRNESSYDLNQVDLIIILKNEKGEIIGINMTHRGSIRARESQTFKVTWPYSLGGNVLKMEVNPQSNVFIQ